MAADKPYYQHLNASDDLVTPYAAIRAGFVALALEKNRRATPFVEQARVLKVAASRIQTPIELVNIEDIQPALLTAAGVSDKAAKYLEQQDKIAAIRGLIEDFLEPAGANFIEELVFRFLLIRGDTLGGSMRNVGGILAQRKLTRMLISTLNERCR
ncbi:MAG: AvaI/BsoBI family type II restriction endonuclease [Coleofasciculus sp. B1-GNL1-01]